MPPPPALAWLTAQGCTCGPVSRLRVLAPPGAGGPGSSAASRSALSRPGGPRAGSTLPCGLLPAPLAAAALRIGTGPLGPELPPCTRCWLISDAPVANWKTGVYLEQLGHVNPSPTVNFMKSR